MRRCHPRSRRLLLIDSLYTIKFYYHFIFFAAMISLISSTVTEPIKESHEKVQSLILSDHKATTAK